MTGAARRRKGWLLLVGHLVRRLGIGAGGEEAVEAAVVLGLHHDVLVGRRRVELRKAPLLPWHDVSHLGLPQRLDVVQPRLHGER